MKRRYKNRLEKLIQKEIDKECKPRIGYLWGQGYKISPPLISEKHGDGLQLVYVQTTDCRPDYYVLRVDSQLKVNSDDFSAEILLCAIEAEYGNVYWDEGNGEERDFPALSTGNGYCWGTIRNFGNIVSSH